MGGLPRIGLDIMGDLADEQDSTGAGAEPSFRLENADSDIPAAGERGPGDARDGGRGRLQQLAAAGRPAGAEAVGRGQHPPRRRPRLRLVERGHHHERGAGGAALHPACAARPGRRGDHAGARLLRHHQPHSPRPRRAALRAAARGTRLAIGPRRARTAGGRGERQGDRLQRHQHADRRALHAGRARRHRRPRQAARPLGRLFRGDVAAHLRCRPRAQHRHVARHAGADDHPRRGLQGLQHDRLEDRLGGGRQGGDRTHRQGAHVQRDAHQRLRASRRHRPAERP